MAQNIKSNTVIKDPHTVSGMRWDDTDISGMQSVFDPLYRSVGSSVINTENLKKLVLMGKNRRITVMLGNSLGGSPVTAVLTRAPGNDAPMGGVKVVSEDGWFAVRPSGTEPICKVYTESFKGEEHLCALQKDALGFLERLLKRGA